MTTHQEEQFREREFREGLAAMRRPEDMGAIPGARFSKGPLKSVCCKAESLCGIWIIDGFRTGQCSVCWNDAKFEEVVS